MDIPSMAIVIAIIVQTIVMIIFLLLSTGKIEAQTMRLADKFTTLITSVNKIEGIVHHQDKIITDHEQRLRASEKMALQVESRDVR